MDRLLEELTGRGVLDGADAQWARAHQAEQGGTLDTALLELDLLDEQDLLAALKTRFGKRVAARSQLAEIDPGVAARVPRGFSNSFALCPVRLEGRALLTLVQSPLPADSVQELRELFGLEVQELIAPAHYIALGRGLAYGVKDERAEQLEQRLARRRQAPDLVQAVSRMARAGSVAASIDCLLEFAGFLVEHACILIARKDGLHLIRFPRDESPVVPVLGPGCTLQPAIAYGGYFAGSLTASDADVEFYRSLGRSVPKKAFVAPAPMARGGAVVLCADNGPRGIATSWIAQLTVLLGRLGHVGADAKGAPVESSGAEASAEEARVLARLRAAASEAGVELSAFVDQLLASRAVVPSEPVAKDDSASALVGEMKGLFERLATDIPAHLARGMEAAFRDLAPRLSSAAPVSPAGGDRPRASASLELVQDAAPREVGDYAAKRQKARRLKL